jgi:hypothetical protein
MGSLGSRGVALLALVVVVGVVGGALAGCVEKENEKVDEAFVQSNLLTSPPTPQHVVHADLAGVVEYLGCDVDKERADLGDRVKITHYWKVTGPGVADWKPFTHVNGPAGDWINVDETKMRKQYGTDKWKLGDVIRDEQVFPILKTWKSSEAVVYIGMYRRGGQGERDRMQVKSGPNDGHNRVQVVKIAIGPAVPVATAPPTPFVVRHTTGPIKIDGKADEPDWAGAQSTGPFKTAEGGADPGGNTTAKLLWDDKNLYVFADIADKDVATPYTQHDDPLWKADAFELFIDADKNGHGYVELQVNPRNATFDAWFPNLRPESDPKWDSGMVSAVTVDGTLDKRDDVDQGWHVELAIPLAAVKGKDDKMDVRLPPRVGDTWKLDLVRVEKPKEGAVTASAWAAISLGDFHAIDKLMTVTFGDEKGGTIPMPETPGPDAKTAKRPAKTTRHP